MKSSYRFRVFLSYAHADRELVQQIASLLETTGIKALWDKDINPGKPFTDEIKDLIAQSHIFIPVITENSQNRPWVHQEIGFAIALNIPVLPISIGGLPSEMISAIHAINLRPDLYDFVEKWSEINIERLIIPPPQKPYSLIEVADWPEDRGRLMTRYTQWVLDLGEYSMLRSHARSPLFSMPAKPITDPIWNDREGSKRRSDYFLEHQRQERILFERIAHIAGCRIIFDIDAKTFSTTGPLVRKTRLQIFLDFLKNIPANRIEVAISPKAHDKNLIIVGDFFSAETMVSRTGTGYLQTVFRSHPPTVLQQIRRYDQFFEELKSEQDVSAANAIQKIEAILETLGEEFSGD